MDCLFLAHYNSTPYFGISQRIVFLDVMLGRLGASNLFGEETLEVLHLFDEEELDDYLSQTGFRGFAYTIYGVSIVFHAEKG